MFLRKRCWELLASWRCGKQTGSHLPSASHDRDDPLRDVSSLNIKVSRDRQPINHPKQTHADPELAITTPFTVAYITTDHVSTRT